MRDNFERVREALTFINSDRDRESWVYVGMGVHDELGEDGWPLWDEWSAEAKSYNAATARDVWKSFKPGGGKGFGYVVNLAKEFGFDPRGKGKPISKQVIAEREAKNAARRAQHEIEEAKEVEEATGKARERWGKAVPASPDHPYLKKKGVQPHGLRVGKWPKKDVVSGNVLELEDVLMLPVMNRQREIMSLQGITTTGDKTYLSGGDKRGHFYTVGDKPQMLDGAPVFHFAEGFATAASAHEATGHLTLCCYDAGNLVRVVRAVRERLPGAHLVILADNDTETEAAGKGNAGMKKATEAALETGARVAFIAEGGDFNDLAQAQGAEAIRARVAAAVVPTAPYVDKTPPATEKKAASKASAILRTAVQLDTGTEPLFHKYFEMLGFDRDEYFIYHRRKQQVLVRTRASLNRAGLFELAPREFWEMNFSATREGGASFDDVLAAQCLYEAAHARGVYDPTTLRGRGAWKDDGRMVYHSGDRLFVDGSETDLGGLKSRFLYERSLALPAPTIDPMSDDAGVKLAGLLQRFGFTKPDAAKLLAGWIFLAPIAGALRWRPHLWVFGPAGAGKTTLLQDVVAVLLGQNKVYSQGDSTEAGIRQTLRSDALPLLIDESEAKADEAQARVQKTLVMLRQASSRSDAKTLRGTARGQAEEFHVQSMALLGSIAVAIAEKADNDRFCRLELKARDGSDAARASWSTTAQHLLDLRADQALPQRLLSRAIAMFNVIDENITRFIRAATAKFGDPRHGDQYGTLLAGWWSLIHSSPATAEQAERVLAEFAWSDEIAEHAEGDGEKCIRVLCDAQVRAAGGESYPVRTLLARALGQTVPGVVLPTEDAKRLLNDQGIGLTRERQVAFANQHSGLKRLLAGEKFVIDLRSFLLQVPGAVRLDPRRFGVGAKQRAIGVPFREMGLERDDDSEESPL